MREIEFTNRECQPQLEIVLNQNLNILTIDKGRFLDD